MTAVGKPRNGTGRYLGLLLIAALPALAQQQIDPTTARGAAAIRHVEEALASIEEGDPLSCSVRVMRPLLNFALRYQAGYQLTVPINQFPAEEINLRAVVRVTSSAGAGPFYFWQDATLPAKPRHKRLEANLGGGFFVGEGNYRTDLVLADDRGRFCREQWDFKLKLKGNERKITQFIEPGHVTPLILDEWEEPSGDSRPYRIAVFLHASPLLPRSIRLNSYDQSLLVTTLTSLFEDTPFHETRFHAINLQQQREIFSCGKLDSPSFRELLDTMEELQLGTIDMTQLSNPRGHVNLLARLVNNEIASDDPPDAIIFIGPNSRFTAKFPPELIEADPGKTPLFFYLHLDYYARWWPYADTIEKLTKSQDGKVFSIHHPKQFAAAIRKIESMLERAKAGTSD